MGPICCPEKSVSTDHDSLSKNAEERCSQSPSFLTTWIWNFDIHLIFCRIAGSIWLFWIHLILCIKQVKIVNKNIFQTRYIIDSCLKKLRRFIYNNFFKLNASHMKFQVIWAKYSFQCSDGQPNCFHFWMPSSLDPNHVFVFFKGFSLLTICSWQVLMLLMFCIATI
jgi:hypothetical protein